MRKTFSYLLLLAFIVATYTVLSGARPTPPRKSPSKVGKIEDRAKALTGYRDPFLQPFATGSIWNTPIGSGARYVPANIPTAENVGIDDEYILRLSGKLNERRLYAPDDWNKRAVGTKRHPAPFRQSVPLPDDLIFADARPGSTPNNCVAFLLPDERTVVNLAPFTRVEKGGPAYAWDFGALSVVTNNCAKSVGGGGLPRQPLATPLLPPTPIRGRQQEGNDRRNAVQ